MAIIQEKGMVRAIKGAYRHGGYNVLNLDGDVVIYTEEWCVRCPWNKLPRKALATIVEHLGMIPENGEAVNIEKDGQPQAIMAGVATEEAAGWTFSPATVGASYVPVTFRGYQLFQEVNSRQAHPGQGGRRGRGKRGYGGSGRGPGDRENGRHKRDRVHDHGRGGKH